MYPAIELFYEKNKDILFGDLKPSKSVVKDVENCFNHFKTYWQQGHTTVSKSDVPQIVNKYVDENTRNQNIRVMQEFGYITSTEDSGVYRFTDNFISLCNSSQPLGIVVLDALYSIHGLDDLTMYLNYLLCCLREAYTFGEVMLFPDSAEKFIKKVPDKTQRDKYRQRVFDMYRFIGDTRRPAPHLTTDEYTPNASYMSRTELENLGLLVKGNKRDNLDTLVLTTNGHHLLQKIDENLSQTSKIKNNMSTVTSVFNGEPLQRIFYGAPGTGKSHEIKEKTEGQKVVRTTFHPDSDYSSFVGAYKPTMEEVNAQVVPVVVNSGISLDQNQGTYKEKRITYKFVIQAFLKAYLGAWKLYSENPDSPDPQFLVIEEINRGNCAQIFGDLFQLLDRNENGFSEYPIEADSDLTDAINIAFTNEKSDYKLEKVIDVEGVIKNYISNYGSTLSSDIQEGRVLLLPPNLFIWATMNTSDQSLFPIDSAFKRRWDWQYLPVSYQNTEWKIMIGTKPYRWVDFQKIINGKIYDVDNNSEDKQLGDYFVNADRTGNIISAETLLNKILFYLWNDVCKDDPGQIFQWKDDNDNNKDKSIKFSEFFCGKDEMERKLQGFMAFNGINALTEGTAQSKGTEEEDRVESDSNDNENIDVNA